MLAVNDDLNCIDVYPGAANVDNLLRLVRLQMDIILKKYYCNPAVTFDILVPVVVENVRMLVKYDGLLEAYTSAHPLFIQSMRLDVQTIERDFCFLFPRDSAVRYKKFCTIFQTFR